MGETRTTPASSCRSAWTCSAARTSSSRGDRPRAVRARDRRRGLRAGARHVDVDYRDPTCAARSWPRAPRALGGTPPWMRRAHPARRENGAAVDRDLGRLERRRLRGPRPGAPRPRARMPEVERAWLERGRRAQGRRGRSSPTRPSAGRTEVFGEPDVERLWQAVAHALRLDEADPAAAWERAPRRARGARAHDAHRAALRRAALPRPGHRARGRPDRGRALDGRPRPHGRGPGARREHAHRGGLHEPAPDARRGHGPRDDAASRCAAAIVEGLELTLRGRRDRRGRAPTRGEDLVRAEIATDDGARRLGELALVDASSRVGDDRHRVPQHAVRRERRLAHRVGRGPRVDARRRRRPRSTEAAGLNESQTTSTS